MRNKKVSIVLLLTFSLILTALLIAIAQKRNVKISTEEKIKAELALVPCKNEERFDAVRKLFENSGATDSDITIEKYNDIQNLVVRKKGKTDEIVVVGAHYDKVKDGCGAIDNWTGIVIVANLYRTFKSLPTDKTYLFVAFDKEESGLLGSSAMVKEIPKERRGNYCSMINFDSFGFNYPQVLDNATDSKMTKLAETVAADMKIPFGHASFGASADADSSSFLRGDVPAVTFHGLSRDWKNYLHSSNDKPENVNSASVYTGYVFALQYLSKIDANKCDDFIK